MFDLTSTNSVWTSFDNLFRGFSDVFDDIERDKIRYVVPSYPKADIYVEEDGALVFNFALAGFSKDDISINFEGDYLILGSKKEEESEDKKKYIVKQIKKQQFEFKYLCPVSKFNVDESKAKFENGLLEIVVPPTQKKEKKPVIIN